MTNKKSTKRALLMSALSLLLCVSMLIGSTFAWFTDSATSGVNTIQAGNLDVVLEYATWDSTTGTWTGYSEVTKEKCVFNETALWEPGYTEVVKFRVTNAGTLALKYQLGMDVYSETESTNVENEKFKLSDSILVGSTKVSNVTERNAAAQYATKNIHNAKILNVENIFGTEIPANFLYPKNSPEGQAVVNNYCSEWVFVVHMPETVGNEANHKTGVEAPKITFGVNLIATQATYEKDSFDDQYDKYASVASLDEMKKALADGHTEFNFMGHTINLNYGLTKAMVPADTTITISNANINGKSYGNGVDGTVIFENCTFNNTGAYSIHFDKGAGDVVFKNCTLYGWNSFGSSLNSVSFYDSALYGNGTYALIRSYVDLYLENCTYDISNANHTDGYSEGVEAVSGAQLEMVNCSEILSSAEAFIGATEGGNVSITEDIVYNNTNPEKQLIMESDAAINFDGNGKTITTEGADPSIGNHGYVAFVPPAGEDVTVSDLTVTGTGFVELGDWSAQGGDYVANNLVVKDLVSTLANGDKGKTLACGFAHYGNATLNNCVMTGTTAMIDGAMAVDAGFVNGTTTVVNGGKYGVVYCWSQAFVTIDGAEVDALYVAPINGTVTIAAGTHIGTLNVDYGTSASNATRLAKIVIEDGATIDAIEFEGNTYTVATWNDFVAAFGA